MTINISEELPARKHAPVADKKEGGEKPAAKEYMTFAIVPEEKILI